MGNSRSWAPSATSRAAATMAWARGASRSPRAWLVSAAASLTRASARRNRRGIGVPEIGKFRTARWVDAPYRASAGTSISPMESFSIRVAGRSLASLVLIGPDGTAGRSGRRAVPGHRRRRAAERAGRVGDEHDELAVRTDGRVRDPAARRRAVTRLREPGVRARRRLPAPATARTPRAGGAPRLRAAAAGGCPSSGAVHRA